jgi:hypothetical protein
MREVLFSRLVYQQAGNRKVEEEQTQNEREGEDQHCPLTTALHQATAAGREQGQSQAERCHGQADLQTAHIEDPGTAMQPISGRCAWPTIPKPSRASAGSPTRASPRPAADHSHAELSTRPILHSNFGLNSGARAAHGGSRRFDCRQASDYAPIHPPQRGRILCPTAPRLLIRSAKTEPRRRVPRSRPRLRSIDTKSGKPCPKP